SGEATGRRHVARAPAPMERRRDGAFGPTSPVVTILAGSLFPDTGQNKSTQPSFLRFRRWAVYLRFVWRGPFRRLDDGRGASREDMPSSSLTTDRVAASGVSSRSVSSRSASSRSASSRSVSSRRVSSRSASPGSVSSRWVSSRRDRALAEPRPRRWPGWGGVLLAAVTVGCGDTTLDLIWATSSPGGAPAETGGAPGGTGAAQGTGAGSGEPGGGQGGEMSEPVDPCVD